MGQRFSMPYQVPFYETDITHQVKLPHLLAVALQVSSQQSQTLGNADDTVFQKYHLVWVITDYAIEINRLPHYNEEVTITTEATAYNKLFCYRDFEITDAAGNLLVLIKTTFVLLDYETRKVAEVPDELVAPYEADKIKGIIRGPRYQALQAPEQVLYHVRFFDLDMNGHVNNGKYLEWMLDVFDLDFLTSHTPAKIDLKYVKEIHHGKDILSEYDFDETSLVSQHQITVDDGIHAQAIIQWKPIREGE